MELPIRIIEVTALSILPLYILGWYGCLLAKWIDRRRGPRSSKSNKYRYSDVVYVILVSGLANGVLFLDTKLLLGILGVFFVVVVVASILLWALLAWTCNHIKADTPGALGFILNGISIFWLLGVSSWFLSVSATP